MAGDDIDAVAERLYLLRLRDEAARLAEDCVRVAAVADAAARGLGEGPGLLPLDLDPYMRRMVEADDEGGPLVAFLRAARRTLDHIRVEVAIMLRTRR